MTPITPCLEATCADRFFAPSTPATDAVRSGTSPRPGPLRRPTGLGVEHRSSAPSGRGGGRFLEAGVHRCGRRRAVESLRRRWNPRLPPEREPRRILADVLDGKVSAAVVCSLYGAVPASRRRRSMRRRRKGCGRVCARRTWNRARSGIGDSSTSRRRPQTDRSVVRRRKRAGQRPGGIDERDAGGVSAGL